MNITRGRIPCGQKVVIYGVPGIGKTTLAAQFPGAVFIDTEGSTRNFDVARLDPPTSWEMVKSQAQYVLDHPEGIGTLVIDTADWAAKMCNQAVCQKAGKSGIEDFGYGNGYTYAAEEYGRLLDILDRITIQRGIHVVVTAHSVLKHVEQPDQFGKYDQWELKCDPKIAALTKEWADMILFCNYKVMVVTDKSGQKGKGQGGQRTMYTSTRPAFVAKNRHGLPEEMPMEFGRIAHIFGGVPRDNAAPVPEPPAASAPQELPANPTPAATNGAQAVPATAPPTPAPDVSTSDDCGFPNTLDKIHKPLADLMRANQVTPLEIQMVVAHKGYFPVDMPVEDYPQDFVEGCLVAAWPTVLACVQKEREPLPF